MSTITILKIKSVAWGAEKLRMAGLSFKHQAKLTGGSSRSVLSESGDTLVVMLENVPEERIRLLSDATADFARREGCDYECTRIEREIEGFLSDATTAANEVASARLTRSFLMGLPDTAYIVSNLCDHSMVPLLAEPVGGLRERAHLWERAKSLGVDNRNVHVVWSDDDFAKLKFFGFNGGKWEEPD